MYTNIKPDRDPFALSLRAARAVNSHSMVPVVADDGINRAWDARFQRQSSLAPARGQSAVTRQIESLLARYFAHGCCAS